MSKLFRFYTVDCLHNPVQVLVESTGQCPKPLISIFNEKLAYSIAKLLEEAYLQGRQDEREDTPEEIDDKDWEGKVS